MKLSYKFSHNTEKQEKIKKFQYVWNPDKRDWHNVIEDYLTISRMRIEDKFSIFKLQGWILEDLTVNIKVIDHLKEEINKINSNINNSKEKNNIIFEDINKDISFLNRVNKSLMDIMDGVAWRYFSFNRPLLNLFADKQSSGLIRPNEGLIASLRQYSEEIFLNPKNKAILNDITNFLRIGDITVFDNDKNLEIIEVKGKKRKAKPRIRRQKKRMSELIEFANTESKNVNGKKFQIIYENFKHKNYLYLLRDSIKNARNKGYNSILIGDYLILFIFYPKKIKRINSAQENLKKKYSTIKDEWKKCNDVVIDFSFMDKFDKDLNFTIASAPYSIYPFANDICADIMNNDVEIRGKFNVSKVLKKFEESGWEVIDDITKNGNNNLKKKMENFFCKIRKNGFIISIPANTIPQFFLELISPEFLIEQAEFLSKKRKTNDIDIVLINDLKDKTIWK
jgi:hypothetical protein